MLLLVTIVVLASFSGGPIVTVDGSGVRRSDLQETVSIQRGSDFIGLEKVMQSEAVIGEESGVRRSYPQRQVRVQLPGNLLEMEENELAEAGTLMDSTLKAKAPKTRPADVAAQSHQMDRGRKVDVPPKQSHESVDHTICRGCPARDPSPCMGPIIDKFKAEFPRQPRVAVVIAERLHWLPERFTERMERFATPLQGADVFAAIEPEDAKYVKFLKPVPKKVGLFNRSIIWETSSSLADDASNVTQFQALYGTMQMTMQLLRVWDAFNLIRSQETAQGWKYDVVARLRLESVTPDICIMGLNQGCNQPGALTYAMAAHTLQAKRGTVFMQHDRAFLGRREDMERLLFAVNKYVGENTSTKVRYADVTCDPGTNDMCTHQVKIAVSRRKPVTKITGEETLGYVLEHTHGFTLSETYWGGQFGGALAGMDIRRYSLDYPNQSEDKSWNHELNSTCDPYPERITWTKDQTADLCTYYQGCAPYPRVRDRSKVATPPKSSVVNR